MADLASTDLTLTLQSQHRDGTRKVHVYKIEFGDGALTYPAGGVPLPAKESFGMAHELAYLRVIDSDDSQGIVWKYDYANKKLRGYIQGVDVSAAGAATLDDFPINTTNETLATGSLSVSLNNNAGTGKKYFGRLLELASAGSPVAAQTLYAEAVGF